MVHFSVLVLVYAKLPTYIARKMLLEIDLCQIILTYKKAFPTFFEDLSGVVKKIPEHRPWNPVFSNLQNFP